MIRPFFFLPVVTGAFISNGFFPCLRAKSSSMLSSPQRVVFFLVRLIFGYIRPFQLDMSYSVRQIPLFAKLPLLTIFFSSLISTAEPFRLSSGHPIFFLRERSPREAFFLRLHPRLMTLSLMPTLPFGPFLWCVPFPLFWSFMTLPLFFRLGSSPLSFWTPPAQLAQSITPFPFGVVTFSPGLGRLSQKKKWGFLLVIAGKVPFSFFFAFVDPCTTYTLFPLWKPKE